MVTPWMTWVEPNALRTSLMSTDAINFLPRRGGLSPSLSQANRPDWPPSSFAIVACGSRKTKRKLLQCQALSHPLANWCAGIMVLPLFSMRTKG
jgi:hypothetical protein